jgi:hypothetical protein
MEPLPNDAWLDTATVVTKLEAAIPTSVRGTIPTGTKNNVYVVVDNSANVARRKSGLKNQFWDDCGAWDASKASTVAMPYLRLEAGKFRRLHLRNGKLCREQYINKSYIYTEYDPQPHASEYVTLTRYYSSLKSDRGYQRHISWLNNDGQYILVEYRGVFPGLQPHGNCRRPDEEFVRTPASIL